MLIGVLGGRGFLGSEIGSYLATKGHTVYCIDKEEYDRDKGLHFNVLINSNGNSKKFWANENPLEDFELSVESVYRSMVDFSYDKYIYISTLDIYGDTIYGFHKKLAEEIVKKYCDNSHVIYCPAIIGKYMKKGIVKDILDNTPLFVTEDSEIQLITTTDIAEKINDLIKDNRTKGTHVFCSTDSIKVKDIATVLGKKITTHPNAEKQIYNYKDCRCSPTFKFKTCEEYLKEIL